MSKLPGSFENHWVRQYLENMILLGIKNLETSGITVNFKRNFDVVPLNIFLFWHCITLLRIVDITEKSTKNHVLVLYLIL